MWRMVTALLRQRRRLLLATLAVALSVGYLAGALTLLNRVSEGLQDLAAAGAERADLIVEGDVAYESALEQTRRLVPASIAESLRGQPGIAAVVPRIEEITMVLDADGRPVVAPGLSEQPLGTNWPDDEQISPYLFVGDGRPPTTDNEVVIDQRSAEAAGVGVGDQVLVSGKAKHGSYEVVGIVTTREGALPAGSSLALFATDEARTIFDTPDNDNRVAIRLEDGADVEEVSARIRSMLPPGAELVDGETGALHRQESLTRSFALIRVLIMGFAGLALLVGMVTVANSLTLLYSERRTTFATFRLVGAKEHQILGVALTEAALLALVASIIGAPLGLLLGRLIESALGALGTSIPVGGSIVSPSALVTAVVVGAVATVLAAIVPAWRACRVAAIEAIVESEASSPPSIAQRFVRSVLVAIAAGGIVWGFMVVADVVPDRAPLVAGGLAILVVVAAMLPTALSYAVAGGIRAVPTRSSALRRIGARDAVRNRTRTAATTGALLLATAVVAGLAVFLASFAAAIDSDVDQLVRSDLVVDSGTFTRGGLPADLLAQVAELPDVQSVSGWQVGRGYIGQVPVRMTGIDGAALSDLLSPAWEGVAPSSLTSQGVLLSRSVATQLGVSVGDLVPLTFTSDGIEMLEVQGVYSSGSVLLGEAVVDRQTLTRQVPASTDIVGLVALEPDTPAARAAVTELAASYGVDSVLQPDEFVERRSDLLRGFERVIQWMLLFTLVQALVGVVNTLLLSVGERRREFGLLRAAGATRRQILRLVLVEGTSFAVIGTLLGLAVGTLLARISIGALGRFGITGFVVPVPILLLTAVAATALGVLAAVVPARWAAAVPPLEAVVDSGGATTARRPRWRSRRREQVVAVPPLVVAEASGAAVTGSGPAGAGAGAVPGVLPPSVAAGVAAAMLAEMPVAGPRTGTPLPAERLLPPPWPPVSAPDGAAAVAGAVAPSSPLSQAASSAAPSPATAPVEPIAPAPVAPVAPVAPAEPVAPAPVAPAPPFERAPTRVARPEPVSPAPSTPEQPPVRRDERPPRVDPIDPAAFPLVAAGAARKAPEPPVDPPAPEPTAADPTPVVPDARVEPVAPEPLPAEPRPPEPLPAEPRPPEPVPAEATHVAEVSVVDVPVIEAVPVEHIPAVEDVPVEHIPAVAASVATPERTSERAPEPTIEAELAPEVADDRDIARSWLRSTVADSGGERNGDGPAAGPGPGAAAGPVPGTRQLFDADPRATRRPGRANRGAGPEMPAVPERLAEVSRRLTPNSVLDAGQTLAALDAALAPGEEVRHLVQGWAKGLPCVVARTTDRVLVVVSRFPEPLVESLHPSRTSISIYGPPGTDRVSLAVVDGRRLLEVTGIRDGAEAAALSDAPRTAPTGGHGYF